MREALERAIVRNITEEFMTTKENTRWVFTWEENGRNELFTPDELVNFLTLKDTFSKGVFQLERGTEADKLHFQGRVECNAQVTKTKLLKLFGEFSDTQLSLNRVIIVAGIVRSWNLEYRDRIGSDQIHMFKRIQFLNH